MSRPSSGGENGLVLGTIHRSRRGGGRSKGTTRRATRGGSTSPSTAAWSRSTRKYNVGHYARSFPCPAGWTASASVRRTKTGADPDAAENRGGTAAPHRGRLSGRRRPAGNWSRGGGGNAPRPQHVTAVQGQQVEETYRVRVEGRSASPPGIRCARPPRRAGAAGRGGGRRREHVEHDGRGALVAVDESWTYGGGEAAPPGRGDRGGFAKYSPHRLAAKPPFRRGSSPHTPRRGTSPARPKAGSTRRARLACHGTRRLASAPFFFFFFFF